MVDINDRKVYKAFGSSFLRLKDMRTYILTQKERKILKSYIESNLELNGYSVLVLRLKRAKKGLDEDLTLVDQALKKAEG
jgi:hypothetical protein